MSQPFITDVEDDRMKNAVEPAEKRIQLAVFRPHRRHTIPAIQLLLKDLAADLGQMLKRLVLGFAVWSENSMGMEAKRVRSVDLKSVMTTLQADLKPLCSVTPRCANRVCHCEVVIGYMQIQFSDNTRSSLCRRRSGLPGSADRSPALPPKRLTHDEKGKLHRASHVYG